MVTEYNKYLLNKRRMEEAKRKAVESPETAPSAAKEDTPVVKENLTTEQTAEASTETKPKKTDAEKLKKGKK